MADIWLIFAAIAYVLTVLSVIIIWRKSKLQKQSIIAIIRNWPLVDKMLGVLWIVQLLTVFYTQRPQSFALNSVLLLYLVSRINKEILSKR